MSASHPTRNSQSDPVRLAIILVNYHHWQLTLQCLDAILNLEQPAGIQQIIPIVVDNEANPIDQTQYAEWQARYPQLVILPQQTNRGFSGGCNIGIGYAESIGCNLFWLLNNDTTPQPDSLTPLFEAVQNKAILAGSVILEQDTHLNERTHIGSTLHWWTGVPTALTESDFGKNPLHGLCFASMLITQAVWQKLGPLDERYFLYLEDCEYSLRARRQGIALQSVRASRIPHQTGSSTGGFSAMGNYYSHRNRLLLMQQYAHPLQQITCLGYTVLRLLLIGLKCVNNPQKYKREWQIKWAALYDALTQRWGQSSRVL